MLMTSVSGHLLNLDFDDKYRKWWSCSPIELVSIRIKPFFFFVTDEESRQA